MLLFDAASILERPFEGMYFEVLPDQDGFVVRGKKEDASYLADFNMEKHLSTARSRINSGHELVCPTCEEPI